MKWLEIDIQYTPNFESDKVTLSAEMSFGVMLGNSGRSVCAHEEFQRVEEIGIRCMS